MQYLSLSAPKGSLDEIGIRVMKSCGSKSCPNPNCAKPLADKNRRDKHRHEEHRMTLSSAFCGNAHSQQHCGALSQRAHGLLARCLRSNRRTIESNLVLRSFDGHHSESLVI